MNPHVEVPLPSSRPPAARRTIANVLAELSRFPCRARRLCDYDGPSHWNDRDAGEPMRFKILGPLEIEDDEERPVAVTRRLHRATLSLLLLNAGQPCSVAALISALWSDSPPLSPEVSLRSCVYGIRKLLPDSQRLRTHPAGYLIHVDPGELDLHVFRDLAAEGREALDSGNPIDAASALARALDLWRDPPV